MRQDKIPDALRAVWTLYRRGNWMLLEALGLVRERDLEAFEDYEQRGLSPMEDGYAALYFCMCVAPAYGAARNLNSLYTTGRLNDEQHLSLDDDND